MGSETTGRYEMLWDCPGCGTTGLLGLTHRHCPNCGAPQDPSRRYFPSEDQKVAVADHPYQGVDVKCPACDTPNAAKSHFCVACGSPLDGAAAVGTRATQTAKGAFDADSASHAAKEAEERRQAARREQAEKHAAASGASTGSSAAKKAGIGIAGVLVLGFIAVAVVACGAFLFWKRDAALVVQSHAWERTVAVETFSAKRDAAWRDQVPAAAYDVSCRQEQRDTKKVADGETCVDKREDKGDGTFETKRDCTPKYRDEPVYGDKCSYTVDTWVVTRTEKAAGSGLTPAWPQVALTNPGTCLGCEREGARKETYTLQLLDEAAKEPHSCELAEAAWRGKADGSRWAGSVGVLSGAVDCAALEPR